MRLLVLNSGSSSIKYRLFDMRDERVLCSGLLERIGAERGRAVHEWPGSDGAPGRSESDAPIADHRAGLEAVVAILRQSGQLADGHPAGVGHRVVHGGEAFSAPVLVDEHVLDTIREMIPLAPLHNPANLLGIEIARRRWPEIPQVAVFDTAFHQTMPSRAYRYAVPGRLYHELGVRRYGFHGTSHQHVVKAAAAHLGRPPGDLNLITLHIGSGASATAVRAGQSVDTSMGLTPLEGLMMGTRSGDVDPALHFYLSRHAGYGTDELESLLNRDSGLQGICGEQDMREVHRKSAEGDAAAALAIDMYCYRIRKYIGAYHAVLGRVDAIVFTAGVGENDARLRANVCSGLETLGVTLDATRNDCACGKVSEIQSEQAPVRVLVIRTDEELEIARQARSLLVA